MFNYKRSAAIKQDKKGHLQAFLFVHCLNPSRKKIQVFSKTLAYLLLLNITFFFLLAHSSSREVLASTASAVSCQYAVELGQKWYTHCFLNINHCAQPICKTDVKQCVCTRWSRGEDLAIRGCDLFSWPCFCVVKCFIWLFCFQYFYL